MIHALKGGRKKNGLVADLRGERFGCLRLGLFNACPDALSFVHEPVFEGRHRTNLNAERHSLRPSLEHADNCTDALKCVVAFACSTPHAEQDQ
jgi:hypothetical protein